MGFPTVGTEKVLLRRALPQCEIAMNFVMKEKCFDVDSMSLKPSIDTYYAACILISTTAYKPQFWIYPKY
jgi:hypothetical protein